MTLEIKQKDALKKLKVVRWGLAILMFAIAVLIGSSESIFELINNQVTLWLAAAYFLFLAIGFSVTDDSDLREERDRCDRKVEQINEILKDR